MTLDGRAADGQRGPAWITTTIIGPKNMSFVATAAPASAAWPANNDAYAIPFQVGSPVTFAEVFFITGTAPGTTTFDVGIYRNDFTLITSLGSTACVSSAGVVMPVGGGALATPVTLTRGRYYLAMSSAATTLTVRGNTYGNQFLRAIGMQKMAVAHPLPATFVPASMGTTAFMPLLGMTTLTNSL